MEKADNSFDNLGREGSYVSIGPRWAQAQAAPYFLFKRYTSEGGIRTCALAAGPHVKPRTETDAFLHVMDVTPTLLELAGADASTPAGMVPIRGVSAAGLLSGKSERPHPQEECIAWELAFGRGVRIGDWKALFLAPAVNRIIPEARAKQWLLYNIAQDPGETTDLAAQEPAKLAELIDAWFAYARETGVVVPAKL